MSINWGLAGGGGFQNALATGVQLGNMAAERRDRKEYQNALLQQRQQELDYRAKTAEAQAAEKVQGKQQADMGTFRKLLKHAGQSPEAWQQALSAAQSMGLDVSQVPQQYDPQWAQTQLFIADAVDTPQGAEALSTAGKIAADMGYKPGTPEHAEITKQVFLADAAKPYTGGQGETRLYIPQLGHGPAAPPTPGTVVGGYTFKGGDPKDRNNWEQGGAGGNTSDTFRGGVQGFVPPAKLTHGTMTSGRRTPEGNRVVGGVPNSAHLRGEAVDYDGPDLNALLAEARKLPGVRKAFIHNGHVHTEGDGWAAPYYGKNGTRGLRR